MEIPPDIVAVIVVCGVIGVLCLLGALHACYSGINGVINIVLCPVKCVFLGMKWIFCGCKNDDRPIYTDMLISVDTV